VAGAFLRDMVNEIIRRGLSPVSCGLLTSQPYGFYQVDNASTGSTLEWARLVPQPVLQEGAGTTSTIVLATLVVTVVYAGFTAPVEAASTTSTLVSATLVVTVSYGYYDMLPESCSTTSTLVAATLVVTVQYVYYDIPIEGCSTTSTIVSASLA